MRYILPLLLLLSACTAVKNANWDDIINACNEAYKECKEGCECPEPSIAPTPEPTVEPSMPPVAPTPEPTTPPSDDFYIPINCSNPPKHISSNDGFKCMSSATRGGSVVCLLPWQFTWKPWKQVTDHHNHTFACNKNDDHFDELLLKQNNGKIIKLVYAGCHNYVATSNGWIGRQHWRSTVLWKQIKNRVERIVMIKGNKRTCLKF